MPKPLKSDPAAVAAYAERAAALRWDEAAAKSLEQALDTRWDESLAVLYGAPADRPARRAPRQRRTLAAGAPGAAPACCSRWRGSPAHRASGRRPRRYLHRALAQGAGSEAWEELGHGFAAGRRRTRARLSYANALRASRGEAVADLPGRDLRQKIYDQAAIEERDEHGMPRLRE